MKGTIVRLNYGLGVGFSITTSDSHFYTTIPLNPYESTENLMIGDQVEFDIQKFWETGIEKTFDVAELINNNISDDSLIDELCKKYPNDVELGREVRKYYNNLIKV